MAEAYERDDLFRVDKENEPVRFERKSISSPQNNKSSKLDQIKDIKNAKNGSKEEEEKQAEEAKKISEKLKSEEKTKEKEKAKEEKVKEKKVETKEKEKKEVKEVKQKAEKKEVKGEGKEKKVEAKEEKKEAKGEGKEEEKGKGGEGGGKRPFPPYTPQEANEESNVCQYPPSIPMTEGICKAGENIINTPPQLSDEGAQKAEKGGGSPSFWTGVIAGTLGPFYPKWWSMEGAAWGKTWDEFSKAWSKEGTGWDKFYATTDLIYRICDSIDGFLAPIGTVCGIVSYVRFIPIPPIPAIGTALLLVSKICSVISFILNIVKAVIKAIQLIAPAFFAFVLKDNDARKKLDERWKQDLIGFATAGLSIVLSKFSLGKGEKGFKAARAQGMGRAKSLLQGAKQGWTPMKDWVKDFKLLRPNEMKKFFDAELLNAEKGFIFRRNVSLSGKDYKVGYGKTKTETFLQQLAKMPKRTATTIKRVATNRDYWVRRGNLAKWAPEVGYKSLDLPYRAIRKTITEGFKKGGSALLGGPKKSTPVAPQIESKLNKSSDELKVKIEDPKTPLLKTEPIPPETTKTAPSHLNSLAKEEEALKSLSKELKCQKQGGIAGQEEAKDLQKSSKEHAKKAESGKKEVEATKKGIEKDKVEVKKAQEKITEGKAKQKEGEGGFGKVKDEGTKGKGAVPSGKVNPDDVPWYKKPFMWIVEKFNNAKTKVTEGITNIIMKAVGGALGIQDTGKQIDEADKKSKEADNLLKEEGQIAEKNISISEKEIKAGKEGEEKAQKLLEENKKVETDATKGIQTLTEAEQKNVQDQQKTKQEAQQYKQKYGKSFDTINQLSDSAQKGDISPVEISIESEINTIRESLMNLMQEIENLKKEYPEEVNKNAGAIKKMIEENLKGEDSGEYISHVDKSAEELKSDLLEEQGKKQTELQSLKQKAEGFAGKFATTDILSQLGEIEGNIIGETKAFDMSKEEKFRELHEFFKNYYNQMEMVIEENKKAEQMASQSTFD